jgi:hypothetical protein
MASRKKASMASVDFASRPGGSGAIRRTPDLQGTISSYRRNPKKYGGKRRDERGDMASALRQA